jgi:mono/diheme cytochrome c family protein
MAITVMSKQNGSWYWLEATPDGKVIVDDMMDKGAPLEGKDVAMCVGCHTSAADNDMVFTHDFAP